MHQKKQKLSNVSKQKGIKNCQERNLSSQFFYMECAPFKKKTKRFIHIFLGTPGFTLPAPDQIQELIKMNAPPATTIEKRCHFLKPTVHENPAPLDR